MIGASKSAHLTVQFIFFVDKEQTIKSEKFDIKIWNTIESSWHSLYGDGDELKRKIADIENREKNSDLNDFIIKMWKSQRA